MGLQFVTGPAVVAGASHDGLEEDLRLKFHRLCDQIFLAPPLVGEILAGWTAIGGHVGHFGNHLVALIAGFDLLIPGVLGFGVVDIIALLRILGGHGA